MKKLIFILLSLFFATSAEAQLSTKVLKYLNDMFDAEGNVVMTNATSVSIGTTTSDEAALHIVQEASAAKQGLIIDKGSDSNKTALYVKHNSTLSTRYIADFVNSAGTVMLVGSNGVVTMDKLMSFGTYAELTVADGAVTITQAYHSIDGQSDSDDDLATISGGSDGMVLFIRPENAARNITLKHGTGNIVTGDGADYLIPDNGLVMLQFDGTNWRMIGAAGATALNNIADASADGTIDQTGYKQTWTSTLNTAGAVWTMTNTTADLTADVSFMDFKYTDNGDANGFFMRGYDNVSELKWSIGYDGSASFGNVAGTTYGSDGSISDAELLVLDNGATTEILVGGGAGSAPVWTTATGSGAPVRGTSPTFTTSLNVGADDAIAHIYVHDAGTIVLYDDSDDTSVTLGPVANGTTTLGITGSLSVSVNVAGATYGSDASISDAELLVLDNGALTEILVGGGAGSAPVWTTATGSGAPVRATSPTLVTPTLGAAVATSIQTANNTDATTFCLKGYRGDSSAQIDALCVENETAASSSLILKIMPNVAFQTGTLTIAEDSIGMQSGLLAGYHMSLAAYNTGASAYRELVKLESHADSPFLGLYSEGLITMGGVGDTNNEDLTWDFETTANTVGVASTTGVTNVSFTGMGLTIADDFTIYNAVNDGNPVFSLGSGANERFTITATYESGGQLIESVTFATATADSDADDGEMIFTVDGTEIFRIKDQGVDITAGVLKMGTGTADAAGEIGFDGTDKFSLFGANSEDLYLRVGSTADNFILGTATATAGTLTLTGITTVALPTTDDPYVAFNETDGQDWWIGPNDTGNVFEFRWSATAGTTPILSLTEAGALVFEGDTDDAHETTVQVDEPTADRTITFINYSGAVPIVVAQNYTQFSYSEASTVDVTNGGVTLEDGWFTEGKSLKFVVGGTVTGANGTISVGLYLEDGLVCTLTSADGAAGDWVAEFNVVAVSTSAQRIIGVLRAEGGVETKVDYAADTTDITAAGTIPVKLQVALAHADDTITTEYIQIWAWNKAD